MRVASLCTTVPVASLATLSTSCPMLSCGSDEAGAVAGMEAEDEARLAGEGLIAGAGPFGAAAAGGLGC